MFKFRVENSDEEVIIDLIAFKKKDLKDDKMKSILKDLLLQTRYSEAGIFQ
jgi:hypothetical protein